MPDLYIDVDFWRYGLQEEFDQYPDVCIFHMGGEVNIELAVYERPGVLGSIFLTPDQALGIARALTEAANQAKSGKFLIPRHLVQKRKE